MSTSSNMKWGSRIGLILAMAGNAVGLGNFLRFPVQAVQNGGGAFIIPYLVCFILLGIPLLWIEWAMGRFGGRAGNHSTPFILDSMSRGRVWKYVGVFGIFTNIAVVAYYSYIESWAVSYMFYSIKGAFVGMSQTGVAGFFNQYVDVLNGSLFSSVETVAFYVITLLINIYILSKGLGGIEKVAKIGMPLLLLFSVFLAIKGLTLGSSGASDVFPHANAWAGINFLWEIQYSSLWDPKVWLAAAGQIFFTLGLGWGTIQCYAAYVKSNDDIALNAITAGFTNEFVEIVLGSLIVIPIAAGYLGLDWVLENASFGMGFQTMPYLFDQWGPVLGSVSGFLWFGLLFFAGITSSLAMGTPWISFMQDEFGWKNKKAAWTFGAIVLVLGLPTVLFYQFGVFDEYDYWAGTVSLVVFAMLETILFSWIFGTKRGWKEITAGADIRVPVFFKFVIRYVTPVMITLVFLGAVFVPEGNNWAGYVSGLFHGEPWHLDSGSVISKLLYSDIRKQISETTDVALKTMLERKILYSIIARVLLVSLFVFIGTLVYRASRKRKILKEVNV